MCKNVSAIVLQTGSSISGYGTHSHFGFYGNQYSQPIAGEDPTADDSDRELARYSFGENGLDMAPTVNLDFTSVKFNMRLRNIRELSEQKSEEFTLRGTRWAIRVANVTDNRGDRYLSVILLANDSDIPTDVQRHVTATFKLYSPINSHSMTFDRDWGWNKPRNWGFPTFLPWSKVISPSNQFVVNGRALLEVTIEVSESK